MKQTAGRTPSPGRAAKEAQARKPAASPTARKGAGKSDSEKPGQARGGGSRPQTQRAQPKPPFPRQHQEAPGLEAKLEPAPRYEAPDYRPAGKLEGLRALITGGDSGIGRAVALLYARECADVAIVYLPEEQEDAEVTRDAIVALGRRCELLPGDLTLPGLCEAAVERTV